MKTLRNSNISNYWWKFTMIKPFIKTKLPYIKIVAPWLWRSKTTWWKELTHWKRPWYWERLKEAGEGYNRGWDSWMASPTQWTWVWASSGSWWYKYIHQFVSVKFVQSMGSQRVRHDWVTNLKTIGGTNGKEPTWQYRRCKRHGFDSWVGKISKRKAWQLTPIFLPGESHGQGSLLGYSP